MRVIIAGSRWFVDYDLLKRTMEDYPYKVTEVVCGCAAGADALGAKWARENGIPVKEFPADWNRFGRRAGPIRNQQMAEYADALVAFPLKDSIGTRDMIKRARINGSKLLVVES